MSEKTPSESRQKTCVCGHVAVQHDQRRSIPQGLMADYKVVFACGWIGCGCRRYVQADQPVTTEPSVSDRPSVRVPLDLLDSLVDGDDCRFDHHGGCQAHGYLSLEPGEVCPQRELKDLIAAAQSPPSEQAGGGQNG